MNLNADLGQLLRRKTSAEEPAPAGKPSGAPAVKIAQPRVDLLPDKYRQRARERTVRQGALASAVAAVVLVGGTWGATLAANGSAQSELDAAKVVESGLNADMAVYSPVTNLATQTQSLTDTIEEQAARSVDHDLVLERFLAAASGRIELTSVQVDTSGLGSCVSTDPFETKTDVAGCVTFSGTPLDVSGLLSTLSGDEWFIDPYVPSVGEGSSVSGTVGLSEQVRTAGKDDAGHDDGANADDPQTTTTPEDDLGAQDGAQG